MDGWMTNQNDIRKFIMSVSFDGTCTNMPHNHNHDDSDHGSHRSFYCSCVVLSYTNQQLLVVMIATILPLALETIFSSILISPM